MLKIGVRWLERLAHSGLITVLLAFAGTMAILFNFSYLPFSDPSLRSLSGGVGLLDLRLSYDARAAYEALTAYGDAGRHCYLQFLQWDAAFLISYGVGFALLFARLQRGAGLSSAARQCLPWLPLLLATTDAIEDGLLWQLLTRWPQQLPGLARMAGWATLSKHVLTLLCLLAFAVIIVARRRTNEESRANRRPPIRRTSTSDRVSSDRR